MSKIGKKPIEIPEGVTVEIKEEELYFKSPQGELKLPQLEGVKAVLDKNELKFSLTNDSKQSRSNWGTLRSLSNNAVEGLTKGFEKTLILEGVGFKVEKEGDKLLFRLGFSHPVHYQLPAGVNVEVKKNNIIVKGIDKFLVGQTAAEIRSLKKPEPYKGKGIHYSDEVVRRKVGKKAATTA